jgi:DNA mismatch repair protein MutS2
MDYSNIDNSSFLDEKTLNTLEYPKILARLAGYCAFAVSADLARELKPTTNIEEARHRLAETSEAVQLLGSRPDMTIGGARDIRQPIDLARHGGTLTPSELLDIKSTLVSARTLWRVFERLEGQFPRLFEMALHFPPPLGLIDSIAHALER